jgi:hypothetical protein
LIGEARKHIHLGGSVYQRFYGRDIPEQVLAVIDEGLTCHDAPDLVAAHLSVNFSYFGAIDKTLSGFVILDDEDDNYTLWDARGDGSVWWQDHEERQLYHEFASIEDWIEYRSLLANGMDEKDARAMMGEAPPAEERPGVPTTNVILQRFQWLVWLLAQPLRQNGIARQNDAQLARSAAGHFRHSWPTDEAAESAFAAEVGLLAADPNLALYWLLHTSLLGYDDQRQQVLAALGEDQSELMRAFVESFGSLGLAGAVDVLPTLATRRARFFWNVVPGSDGEVKCLVADPFAMPLAAAHRVIQALEAGTLHDAAVAAQLEGVPASVGVLAVRAVLAQREGIDAAAAANAYLAAVGDLRSHDRATESYSLVLDPAKMVADQATDATSLAAAARFMLDHDPFSGPPLRLARRAWELADESSVEAVAALLPAADVLDQFAALPNSAGELGQLLASPDSHAAVLAELVDPLAARVAALRILYRQDAFAEHAAATVWAMRTVLMGTSLPDLEPTDGQVTPGMPAEVLAAGVLAGFTGRAVDELLDELGSGLVSAEDPRVGFVFEVLRQISCDESDFGAEMSAMAVVEACLPLITPWAGEPQVFERIVNVLSGDADPAVVDRVWERLFDAEHNGGVDVVGSLSADQLTNVFEIAVRLCLNHPKIAVRNAARHALDRLVTPASGPMLAEALVTVGVAYAASSPGSGRRFDYNQCDDDLLESLMFSLYMRARRLSEPTRRELLAERLLVERRSFWNLASAIGDVFDRELHDLVMAALAGRPDPWAAGAYAFALAEFVKPGSGEATPAIELLSVLVGFPIPADPVERGFLRYALHVGLVAAVRAHQHELVRAGWAAATAIGADPLSPDYYARRRGGTDPLDEVRAELEAVLSGADEQRREDLVALGSAGRESGRPLLDVSDEDLGVLAGATLARRVWHDQASGEVWFLDADGAPHAFDGYGIVEVPFTVTSLPVEPGAATGFLAGVATICERALLWSKKATRFAEFVRFDDRILVAEGVNNGSLARLGYRFADEASAAKALARMVRYQESLKMVPSDPWYLPGVGAVNRIFYIPEPDGTYSSQRTWLNIVDGQFLNHDYGTDEAAIAAHEQWVLEACRDRGGVCITVETLGTMRRASDLTMFEWIKSRLRNGGAVALVRAVAELAQQLKENGYQIGERLAVEVGAGVEAAEIEAFEAGRSHPIPGELREFWETIGSASWQMSGGPGLRILRPSEVTTYEPEQPQNETLQVVVVTAQGDPVAVVADREAGDGVAFALVSDLSSARAPFSWLIANSFAAVFTAVVDVGQPLTHALKVGERVNPESTIRRFEKDDWFTQIFVDPALALVTVHQRKRGAQGATKARRYSTAAKAYAKAEKVAAKLVSQGYIEAS